MLPQSSLLSHFQGCLLGLVVGAQWSQHPETVNPLAAQPVAAAAVPPDRWSPIAIALLQTLTRSHQWQSAAASVTLLNDVPAAQRQASGLAIATLPLALYFHDDLPRQSHTLLQLSAALELDAINQTWLLGFAYVIAQAVKGQLDPDLLIPQTLAYLRLQAATEAAALATVSAAFAAVARAQATAASLAGLQADGLEQPLAIALTCFLQTPNDLRLALTRATRWRDTSLHSQAVATIQALTGALVGAHASVAGIPASTRLAPPVMPLGPGLMALADDLLASWSGIYQPGAIAAPLPVAAPWVMRPSSLSHRK